VPEGTGLDSRGEPSTDPAEIIKGVLLPFGGYKGSAISLMIELLAAGLTGEQFSYEAKENDNGDGGPPRGGEIILSMSPDIIAGPGWEQHVEKFANKMSAMEGVRMPGARRHKNRLDKGIRKIDTTLLKTIRELS
jgi:delta1-piperideine-2-carboxylate reductase